jgi:uncharacterized membrane protein YkvA (DUF1232 family)
MLDEPYDETAPAARGPRFPGRQSPHRRAEDFLALHMMPKRGGFQVLKRLKELAGRLKLEAYALYLASRDPRVPWYAKALAAFVVAHTFSPIDLIPDFIPVLGYLDDLIITPLGIYLALKMIPPEVMAEARQAAAKADQEGRIQTRAGIAIVISIWILGCLLVAFIVFKVIKR